MAHHRTLRKIARRMGWKSPATILRRHLLDDFPMYPDWTKRGLIWVTSDALIDEWERRKAAVNVGARIKAPWKWRRHRVNYKPYNWRIKNRTAIETKRAVATGENAPELREGSQRRPEQRATGCTCGTPTPCTAH